MPKSSTEIRQQLGDAEPDEQTYRGLGPDEVEVLAALLDDEEAWLAARAVYALSRINSDDARRNGRGSRERTSRHVVGRRSGQAAERPVHQRTKVRAEVRRLTQQR